MPELVKASVIAAGAVLGALARYYAVLALEHWNQTAMPIGVLLVNWLGSFSITLVAWYLGHRTGVV